MEKMSRCLVGIFWVDFCLCLSIEDGWLSAGYQYINIDDCWMLPQRDTEGYMVPDPKRFPSGMKKLGNLEAVWRYQA